MTTKSNKHIKISQGKGNWSWAPDNAFIRTMAENKEAAQNYAGAMNMVSQLDQLSWKGDSAVIPNSPLWEILEAFKAKTDLPLDLAYHSFMFYLSTYCMELGVEIEVDGQTVQPALWTVVLAPSGSGKSYSLSRLKKTSPVQATVTGFASAAKLIEMLSENEQAGRPNAIQVDEWGQVLRLIENPNSPLAEAKQYLLLAYDGDLLERKTKQGTITVNRSFCSFLGLNVDETFIKILSPDSLLDGFAQRFAYVLAEKDPERKFYKYARYNNKSIEEVIAEQWERIKSITIHKTYTYSPEALAAYDLEFEKIGRIIDETQEINVSFFRRIMQRTHALALMMHIINEDSSDIITKSDVLWAIRQTRLHIADAAKLIAMKSPQTNNLMKKVKETAKKLSENGKKVSGRTLQQNIRDLKGDSETANLAAMAYENMGGLVFQDAREFDAEEEISFEKTRPLQSDSPNVGKTALSQPLQSKTLVKNDHIDTKKTRSASIDDLITGHRDERGNSTYTGL